MKKMSLFDGHFLNPDFLEPCRSVHKNPIIKQVSFAPAVNTNDDPLFKLLVIRYSRQPLIDARHQQETSSKPSCYCCHYIISGNLPGRRSDHLIRFISICRQITADLHSKWKNADFHRLLERAAV